MLAPFTKPTAPAVTPRQIELDPATNLHMTGSAQDIDLAKYHLDVTGMVDHPLKLSLDDLRCMPRMTDTPTLTCSGVFEDVATWSGVQLKYLLNLAGIRKGAKEIRLTSADGYEVTVELGDAMSPENFLAYEWSGQPLPIMHGFPLRAVFPNLLGNNWVKWLVWIQVQ